ncbi:MAG: glycosyltransferase family 2 protein [Desulfovibrionaceae bacterium]|nr:glycosyltransferase family 2 protein [Desulfovibrionaceae bacterium]
MGKVSVLRNCAQSVFYFLIRLLLPLVPFLARFPLAWRVRDAFLSGPDGAAWLRQYGPDWDAPEDVPPEPLTVLLDGRACSSDDRDRCLRDLESQTVPPRAVITVGHGEDSGGPDSALFPPGALPETGHVLVLAAGCRPHSRMLERVGQALREAPGTDLLYVDEWRLKGERVTSVYCKPSWDPLYFAATRYTGDAFAVAAALFCGVMRDGEADGIPFRDPVHLFALCQARSQGEITHLPVPLFGVSAKHGERPIPAQPVRPTTEPPLAEPPVSIIIPFRNRPDLLRPCLDSLRSVTGYSAWECILVDNGSTDSTVKKLCRSLALEDRRFTILEHNEPFNFSRLVNRGAAKATGDILVLLNSDVEAREPSWLQALVRFAAEEEVGCVGAKLLYPNGLVQHGGIVGGLKSPLNGELCFGHAHLGLPGNAPGYFRQLAVSRTVLAVTGAALAVRKTVFDRLGGFDESLAVAFNDVDFCLRAAALGLRTVWTPEASLLHHESATRGLDLACPEKSSRLAKELALLLERWGDAILDDPWYNPNFSAEQIYALAELPRARGPRSLPAKAGPLDAAGQRVRPPTEPVCHPA